MMDKADFIATTITMLMDGNHVAFADVVAHVSQYVSHYFPDRIPSTTPGAEPPRGTKDSGSARSHSTHLETSTQKRP